MKTPYLDAEIYQLEEYDLKNIISKRGVNVLIEYKKIKQLLESIKQKETNKRYFIVSFSGINDLGNVTGFIDFSTDGGFLSCKKTIEQIKEKQELKECVITNIMEISEQDWNDWNN
jgi:hypothetical protein